MGAASLCSYREQGKSVAASRRPRSQQPRHNYTAPFSDPPQPPDLRTVLELVSQNPVLQQAHVINGALVVQGLNAVESPVVCQSAKETLVEMIQGNGPSFAVLKGACLTLSQQCRASISLAPACIFYFILFADAPILCHHHHHTHRHLPRAARLVRRRAGQYRLPRQCLAAVGLLTAVPRRARHNDDAARRAASNAGWQ